jgi:hypothetical protein
MCSDGRPTALGVRYLALAWLSLSATDQEVLQLIEAVMLCRAAATMSAMTCAAMTRMVTTDALSGKCTILPVITNTGILLGDCQKELSSLSVKERIRFVPQALELFKYPKLDVRKFVDKFLVRVPALRDHTPVSVLQRSGNALETLSEYYSVTAAGQLRLLAQLPKDCRPVEHHTTQLGHIRIGHLLP